MTDNDDELISMSEAGRRLGYSRDTVWGWARYGIGGRRLETVRVGACQLKTSPAMLMRWLDYLAAREKKSSKAWAGRKARRGA